MKKEIKDFVFTTFFFIGCCIVAGMAIMLCSFFWHWGQISLYNQKGYPMIVNNNFNMQDGTTAKIEE